MAEERSRRRPSVVPAILAVFAGAAVLVLTGFFGFYQFVAKPAASPLHSFAAVLERITERKTRVTGSTMTIEKSEVMELAVVQRRTHAIIKYETRWLGSDNLLIVRGEFLVKAGFDLDEAGPFTLADGMVTGDWPPAKVLTVELLDYDVYFSKNGTLNKLKPEDQAEAIRRLLAQARSDAAESDILEDAERRLRQRMEDLGGGVPIDEAMWP
ncbi:MAG: DUF4230 domain-containing protein [Akkermansiaceae bacterium]|nr:DUF4230 domain-containing protein [Akkermansiaceae bacterium]NNM29848.1 DUF4230 domain-containing protein [Akkermansiaceae bacterium]